MAEYIKKDEIIKLIREDKVEITPNLLTIAMFAAPNGYSAEDCYKAINDTCDRHIKEIRNLPGADVIERKKGKWEWYNCVWVCSCCGKNPTKGMGYVQSKEQLFPFCPYCGADMRGE